MGHHASLYLVVLSKVTLLPQVPHAYQTYKHSLLTVITIVCDLNVA